MIETESFRQCMRRLVSGVSIITSMDKGAFCGIVATAVNSVSATPPTLLICINRSASSHDPIAESDLFCVNFLSESDQDIAARFSSSRYRESRFDIGAWQTLATGAPALRSAMASLDCRVTARMAVQSHTIFIGEVVASEVWSAEIAPLAYLDGQYLRPRIES